MDKFKRKWSLYIGLGLLMTFMLSGLMIPYLGLIPPDQTSLNQLQAPNTVHLLGTNDVGQDIFSRILYGLRTSVIVALLVALTTTLMALITGVIAAMLGDWIERVVIRTCDILLSLPSLILIILVASFLSPTLWTIVGIISFFNSPDAIKNIRNRVGLIRKTLYIETAYTFGATNTYVLKRHIIPELIPTLAAIFVNTARTAIFMETGLAYLGIRSADTISLGRIMSTAMNFAYLDVWKWWLVPSGVLLAAFLMSLTYMSNYLEWHQSYVLEERN